MNATKDLSRRENRSYIKKHCYNKLNEISGDLIKIILAYTQKYKKKCKKSNIKGYF